MELDERQITLCDQNETDFSDFRAVYVNCALQHPDKPHTDLAGRATLGLPAAGSIIKTPNTDSVDMFT